MIFPLRSLLSGFFGSVQMPGLAVFVRNCAAAIIPKIHLIGGLAEQMGWNSADTYSNSPHACDREGEKAIRSGICFASHSCDYQGFHCSSESLTLMIAHNLSFRKKCSPIGKLLC